MSPPSNRLLVNLRFLDPLVNIGGTVTFGESYSYVYIDEYYSDYGELNYYDIRRLQEANYSFEYSAFTGSSPGCITNCNFITSGPISLELSLYAKDSLRPTPDVRWQITVSDVPEFSSWAMMIAGFAIAGAALRTRRQPRVRIAFK